MSNLEKTLIWACIIIAGVVNLLQGIQIKDLKEIVQMEIVENKEGK